MKKRVQSGLGDIPRPLARLADPPKVHDKNGSKMMKVAANFFFAMRFEKQESSSKTK